VNSILTFFCMFKTRVHQLFNMYDVLAHNAKRNFYSKHMSHENLDDTHKAHDN
jgi:hypothetical protein